MPKGQACWPCVLCLEPRSNHRRDKPSSTLLLMQEEAKGYVDMEQLVSKLMEVLRSEAEADVVDAGLVLSRCMCTPRSLGLGSVCVFDRRFIVCSRNASVRLTLVYHDNVQMHKLRYQSR